METFNVNLTNQNRVVPGKKGITVGELLRSYASQFGFPCNGNGTCGKCRVRVEGEVSPPTENETRLLSAAELAGGIRLGCQTVLLGPAAIEFAEPSGGQILTEGAGEAVALNSLWESKALAAPADWEECARQLNLSCPPERVALEAIANAAPASTVMLEFFNGRIIGAINAVEPEVKYGAAIDIGTTTVAAYLVNLGTGAVENKASCYNPQARYGADVISRIQHAAEPAGLEELHRSIIGAVNELIGQLIRSNHLSTEQIIQLNCVGNSCMLHLLVGINPAALGRAPFRPVFTSLLILTPSELEIAMNPKGAVFILPGIGGHVGSDISAGALVCQLGPHRKELLLDIGTNGEIVLAGNGDLFACSTAAGPAFEGGRLSCGMMALPGAVTDIVYHGSELQLRTVANQPPVGICGSGLVRIVAELFKRGVITGSGGFANDCVDPNLDLQAKRYYLTRDENRPIYLSQEDIRSFQLGKAAIRCGIELMLRRAGILASELETIYIAGAFGNFLDVADLILLGLIPEVPPKRVKTVGNTAGVGAVQCLISKIRLQELLAKTRSIQDVNLAEEPDFMDIFTDSMLFGEE
jgi:uncharacterized 2Fe-2S/4Fe-4S cluster protein (DUF4445 family)